MTCTAISKDIYSVTCENVSNILAIIWPNYSTTPTETIQLYYGLLYVRVSQKALGLNSNMAFANLMAHYLTIATDPNYATAGVLSDMKLGEANIRYNNAGYNSSADPIWQDLKRTSYGITYFGIITSTIFPAVVSGQSLVMGGVPIALPPPPYYSYGYGGYSGQVGYF